MKLQWGQLDRWSLEQIVVWPRSEQVQGQPRVTGRGLARGFGQRQSWIRGFVGRRPPVPFLLFLFLHMCDANFFGRTSTSEQQHKYIFILWADLVDAAWHLRPQRRARASLTRRSPATTIKRRRNIYLRCAQRFSIACDVNATKRERSSAFTAAGNYVIRREEQKYCVTSRIWMLCNINVDKT